MGAALNFLVDFSDIKLRYLAVLYEGFHDIEYEGNIDKALTRLGFRTKCDRMGAMCRLGQIPLILHS